jgi:hypothetical protein
MMAATPTSRALIAVVLYRAAAKQQTLEESFRTARDLQMAASARFKAGNYREAADLLH